MIIYVCIFFSAVQLIYDFPSIHLHSSLFMGVLPNSQCDQLLVGLIAQLVEHCSGIVEVMGLNPIQA